MRDRWGYGLLNYMNIRRLSEWTSWGFWVYLGILGLCTIVAAFCAPDSGHCSPEELVSYLLVYIEMVT